MMQPLAVIHACYALVLAAPSGQAYVLSGYDKAQAQQAYIDSDRQAPIPCAGNIVCSNIYHPQIWADRRIITAPDKDCAR